MAKRGLAPLLLPCVFAAAAFAGTDPFIGHWKLNASKTKFADTMKVESVGANKYTFDFGGGPETILVDGTDQPAGSGSTFSVTPENATTWTVVRKAEGRTVITARWKLSADGKTLTDDFTERAADGSTIRMQYVYDKKAPGAGFAGTWASGNGTMKSAYVIEVKPWERDGLSFVNPLAGDTKSARLDGRDYPDRTNANATTSMHRVNARTLEMTRKLKGKVTDTREVTLSADLKTLTITVHPANGGETTTFIFDRQA